MIELAEKIRVECFLCRRILEKLKANLAISEAEKYHLSVDLAAINNIREDSSVSATVA